MKTAFLILLLFVSTPLFAELTSANVTPELEDKLGKFIKDLDSLPETLKGIACDPSLKINRDIHPVTIKNIDGKEFQISEVGQDYIDELFNYLAGQKHIPFKYSEDGCYARAEEMSILLEKKGVISGKTFIEGSLRVETKNSPKGYVEWWYHVAPILSVKGNDGTQHLYVIDPSIFHKPVPIEEWYNIQTKHSNGRTDRTYLTPRFSYVPSDDTAMRTEYDEEDLDRMKVTMKRYLKIQQERERLRKHSQK